MVLDHGLNCILLQLNEKPPLLLIFATNLSTPDEWKA